MSDAPERIWAFWTPYEFDDNATITAYETVQHGGQEYIRKDVSDALIAAAYVSASQECLGLNADDVIDSIRALTPTDARAALDALLKAEREKALREAAETVDRVGPRVTGDTILSLISKDKTDGN